MALHQNKMRPTPKSKTALRLRIGIGIVGIVTLLALFWGVQGTNEVTSTQSFTNVAISGSGMAGIDAAVTGDKDGGFGWGDINEDGFLDLVVNTDASNQGTRILIANGSDPANPFFEDKTGDICPHCTTVVKERCAILADINHDGYLDLIRNTSFDGGNGSVMIYLNQGASNNYKLGTIGTNKPNKTLQNSDFHDSKMNTEGVFVADVDNDGWLDLVVENHNYGIDIFQNPKDGTANFTCLKPTDTGLPSSATDGDYGTCVDFDDDGDVDIIARKRNENDFFVNNGDGTYVDGQNIDDANNGNKGGVVFADFDNDGDYDLFWTDKGVNQIWLNNGSNVLVATDDGTGTGEPWISAGLSAPTSGIDGCAVGDVNNDGKIDLFLTADNNSSFLFLNQTTSGGSLDFSRDNLDIDVNGNGEGCAFADYDRDGDLDLYINVKNGNNQLWRNGLSGSASNSYLFVEPRIDLGGGIWRAAIGANIVLQDCDGNVISGIREVPTIAGHGTDAPDYVHFGLPDGPAQLYNVVVKFVTVNGTRVEITKQITPNQISNQTLIIYDTEVNTIGRCDDFDQDGIPDKDDLDDDNDGIPDIAEIYLGDHDADGTPDYADAQFCAATFAGVNGWDCADGLPDPSGDLDKDGIANYLDPDFDNCGGLANGICSFFDKDRDGRPNHLDLDSDDDGIPDLIEVGGTDIEGDGMVDCFDSDGLLIDTDADGWCDTYDSFGATYSGGTSLVLPDSDQDGIQDHYDLDADNDGIPDVIEAGGVDADGDGIADGGVDSDADGFNDQYDPTDNDPESTNDATFAAQGNTPLLSTLADGDSDGLANEGYTAGDTDGDGWLDHLDLDADNDGIPDLVEIGGLDSNGDGKVDGLSGDGTYAAGQDADQDGFYDAYDPDDNTTAADEDEQTDPLILAVSSGTGAANGNPALPDLSGNPQLNAGSNVDADRDGIPNYLDLDSDNDGITDVVETFGYDKDDDNTEGKNGRVDGQSGQDTDQNGWHDSFQGLIPTTTDASGTEMSGNTLPDYATGTGNPDMDGDGLPNYLDIDADDDGIVDLIESQASGTNLNDPFDGLQMPSNNDADYDGLAAAFDPDESGTYIKPENTDMQDTDDYLDEDSDNDATLDIREGHDADTNGQPDTSPIGVDADLDGLDDAFDTDTNNPDVAASNQPVQDTDGDVMSGGNRDWRDVDGGSFPVEYLGFSGQVVSSDIQLEWTTAREENSQSFKIGRSLDGNIFETIGQVAAAGQSSEARQYSFTDLEAAIKPVDRFYYRLQQTDIDGSFEISATIEVRLSSQNGRFTLTAGPSPTTGTLHVAWKFALQTDSANLSVHSLSGKLLQRQSLSPSDQSAELRLHALPAGVYFIQLQDGEKLISKRIIKQ